MFQILIVDNDKNTRRFLCAVLSHAGYRTFLAECPKEALEIMEMQKIDLMILDVQMPGMDGFSFSSMLRNCRYDLPILMLSAMHRPGDICKGFLSGADDYMVKPADEAEMLLRIKALLRRSKAVTEHTLTIGNTILSYSDLTVDTGLVKQRLPRKEFYLLYQLLSYPNQIFTREQLMDAVWGPCSDSTAATVSVHINRLRKRFQNCPDFSIVTVRGLGYKAEIITLPGPLSSSASDASLHTWKTTHTARNREG